MSVGGAPYPDLPGDLFHCVHVVNLVTAITNVMNSVPLIGRWMDNRSVLEACVKPVGMWIISTITDKPVKATFFCVESHDLPRTLIEERPIVRNLREGVVNDFNGAFKVSEVPLVIVLRTKEEASTSWKVLAC